MVMAWHNTDAETAAGMLDVSDEQIQAWSCGEVGYPDASDGPDKADPLLDEGVFGITVQETYPCGFFMGDVKDGNLRMGHIKLAVPVVNPQYVRGKNPVLARETGIGQRDLEDIILHRAYTTAENSETAVIREKERVSYQKAHPGIALKTGADAVSDILQKRESKILPAAVLTVLPVMPVRMRYYQDPKDKIWRPFFGLNRLYERVLLRNWRTKRLLGLKAPDIICDNEIRMLQKAANDLTDNGACHAPCCSEDGIPFDSLSELIDTAGFVTYRKKPTTPDSAPDGGKEYLDLCERVSKRNVEWGKTLEEADAETEGLPDDWFAAEREEFLTLARPFLERIAEEYFPEYAKGYWDELMECGENAASKTFLCACLKKEPLGKAVFPGAYGQVANFVKKRAAYTYKEASDGKDGR